MHIVEGLVSGCDLRRQVCREFHPAPADVNAAEMRPPQDRRGIDHVERVLGGSFD